MKAARSHKSLGDGEEDSQPAKSDRDPVKVKEALLNAEELVKNGKWVYERFNMVTTTSAFPNLV
jgi:hypothetical protein